MAIRVVEFSNGGTKLERFLHKNQHTQKKLLYFENWINGGLRRIIFILPLTLLMNNEIWLYFNAKNDFGYWEDKNNLFLKLWGPH